MATVSRFVAFIIGSYIGEIVNQVLYRDRFREIGDQPAAIMYLLSAIMISFIAVPLLYFIAKKKKPTSRETSASSEKNE